ncbi:hypothetical protein HFN01_35755 [Rhizobium leguminosarum]|uniref:hypothetical protein n=1 Tax=Rhizobium leguminosarum TaxID=384 RepID=UPI0014414B9F|nr:hypothetical protein [Rhizobium leguminosarum]MBY5318573.1 hypothetical protein [Rhizobium leguminosarum]MBY5400149.1 hypothetical protein [Rhizobium leguminosarum]MBY5516772.1 hypothetical protein [Rhizobium leguminosarum]NKK39844.1 hypothetical protein [Rhizobium leguminosarum bv. viciae]
MPKFGSHIIFAELARRKRPDLFVDHHENAYRFGAIGPDTTLFMFDPATNKPELRKGMTAALEVLDAVNRIKEELQRIADELTKPVDDIADWLSGGITKDLKYTVNTALEAVFLAAKLGIAWSANSININNPVFSNLGGLPADFIKNPDHAAQRWVITSTDNFGFPFRMFGHPYTDDGAWKSPLPTGNYDEWWWMDLLHYRKTGAFAADLLSNARGPVQTSYARGYMTHVGGDVSGHPFINSLVEGPFRNHAYRHLVLETLSDTWLWENQGHGDILDARLDRMIHLNVSDSEQVAALVVQSMRRVYQPPMVPRLLGSGYPDEGEFLFAYRFMQNYLRMSTNGSVPRPVPPPDNPNEVIKEIMDLLRKNLPGPIPGWNGNIIDFLKALFSWFGKGLTLLLMIATLPWAVLMRFVALAPRWIIYIINLALFYIVSAIRTMLCLTGWGYCSSEDFKNFGFLRDMIVSRDYEGNQYPQSNTSIPKPPFYWLVSPRKVGSRHEPAATIPLNPNSRGKRPDWMVDPANVMDKQAVFAFGQAATPDETRRLEMRYGGQSVFGNAVDLSIALLDGTVPPFDFDLDGDRGSGYKGWETLPNDYYV